MESSLPLNVKSVSHEIKTGEHMRGERQEDATLAPPLCSRGNTREALL